MMMVAVMMMMMNTTLFLLCARNTNSRLQLFQILEETMAILMDRRNVNWTLLEL